MSCLRATQSWPRPTEGSGSGLASPKVLLIHSLTFSPHESRLFKIKLQLCVIKEETSHSPAASPEGLTEKATWTGNVAQTATMWDPQPKIHTAVLRLEPTTPLPYEWLQKGEVEGIDQERTEVTALRGRRWWEAQTWKHSRVHMQIKTGELCQVGLNATTGTSSDIFISKHWDLVISSKPSPGTESSRRKKNLSSAIWVPGCPSKPVRFSVMRGTSEIWQEVQVFCSSRRWIQEF